MKRQMVSCGVLALVGTVGNHLCADQTVRVENATKHPQITVDVLFRAVGDVQGCQTAPLGLGKGLSRTEEVSIPEGCCFDGLLVRVDGKPRFKMAMPKEVEEEPGKSIECNKIVSNGGREVYTPPRFTLVLDGNADASQGIRVRGMYQGSTGWHPFHIADVHAIPLSK